MRLVSLLLVAAMGLGGQPSLREQIESLRAKGNHGDAEPLLQKLIDQDPEPNADDLTVMALTKRALGKWNDAIVFVQKSISAKLKAGGKPGDTLPDYNLLGQLFIDKQQPDVARAYYMTALSIGTKTLGMLHVNLLPTIDRLALLYRSEDKCAEAEPILRRSLVIREVNLGANDFDLLMTLDGLSGCLFALKKYDEAEPVFERLLAMWEAAAGPDHAMVAQTLEKMAAFFLEQKKLVQAECLSERAVQIRAGALAAGRERHAKILVASGRGHEVETDSAPRRTQRR